MVYQKPLYTTMYITNTKTIPLGLSQCYHKKKRRELLDGPCIIMSKIGFGRTRQELDVTIKKIIDEDGRPTPFKDNKLGKHWLKGFFGRHPELSIGTTLHIGKERALISPDKVEIWFMDFRSYIEDELGDKNLLSDPSRIYNADESVCSVLGAVGFGKRCLVR